MPAKKKAISTAAVSAASEPCTALASMLAKYLREVFMRQFNRYWLSHVPGIKPTAGYPGDAARFYKGIKPMMERMGVKDSSVWRRK